MCKNLGQKESDRLGDLYTARCGLDLSGSGQNRIPGCYAQDNGISGSIKGE
jgi:hypothetical protein